MSRNLTPCAALISGGVAAALFAIGAAGIGFASPDSISVLSEVLHIDIANVTRTVEPSRFFALFVAWTAGTALIAAFAVWLSSGRHRTPKRSTQLVHCDPSGNVLHRV